MHPSICHFRFKRFTSAQVELCDFPGTFLITPLLFLVLILICLEIISPVNSNSIWFDSDSYLEMDVCWVSKHEPFSLQSEINTKCRLCAFLKAQPTLFFLQSLSRLNIYSLSSRTHYHMPQTQIEKWMNWASKHEPFLLSMAKWQINKKLCDFFQRLFSIFFVLLLFKRKIWLISIPTHYQTL